MNNKGTNAYTIRNFRRVKKNAYTRIACVYFASALFAYLRAALYEIATGINKKESAIRVATLLIVIGNEQLSLKP